MKDSLKVLLYASIFLVLFLPVFVSDSMFFPFITGKNFAFRILVEIGLASWILLAMWDEEYRPRFSWMALSGALMLIIMFFADAFGEYPLKSFWSNFERMDGYVTLVHFYFYFLLLGHALRTSKMWGYFLHTSLAVASYVAIYGLAQSVGFIDARTTRIESTLGNAAYMAVYMLFHIFILLFLSLRSRDWLFRGLYLATGLLFAYVLLETGTRGTFIGLFVGASVMVAYTALFGRGYPEVRKFAIGGMVALVVFAGLFYTFRDSSFIQESSAMRRIANISIEDDLVVRATIWGMALEGVKERPILGWGQGNFNYVFNSEYDPSLYAQEQWFDRVHNIFFDWLIAGGILGFIAYFGILFGALYYLFWRPLFDKDETFTVLERAVLLGILAGYFTHNLVVFDNIVSYMYYAVILAVIHSRVSKEIPALMKLRFDRDILTTMTTPAVVVAAIAVIYFVNVPAILAAGDIIGALRSGNDVEAKFTEFQSALDRESFADQEIVEQMSQAAVVMAQDPNIDAVTKAGVYDQTEREFIKLINDKPGDARLNVLFGSYYRLAGKPEKALEQFNIAHELSPNKQSIIFGQGFSLMQMSKYKEALEYLKEAYELDTSFSTAKVYYAVGALYADDTELFAELVDIKALDQDPKLRSAFVNEDLVIQAALDAKDYPLLIYVFTERSKLRPNDAQVRASLAVAYYENGDTKKAVEVLEEAIADMPEFKEQGEQFIDQLKAGKL